MPRLPVFEELSARGWNALHPATRAVLHHPRLSQQICQYCRRGENATPGFRAYFCASCRAIIARDPDNLCRGPDARGCRRGPPAEQRWIAPTGQPAPLCRDCHSARPPGALCSRGRASAACPRKPSTARQNTRAAPKRQPAG